ncbi:NusA-like transcription termination signal-binding factor [Candidatus Woesearchaeota archaeon]|nr:MAG: NusA-like transcription termination signal-binding factor [Candidatus Woesearchaeota archaeon]
MVTYTNDDIKLISLFEKITHAQVKDLFLQQQPIFVVAPGELGKALGKNKMNLFRLENMLKKRVKVVEFSDSVLQFVLNVIAPLKVTDIKQEDKIIILTGNDMKTRGYLIGRNASNLRNTEAIVKHYFPIDEIKVV